MIALKKELFLNKKGRVQVRHVFTHTPHMQTIQIQICTLNAYKLLDMYVICTHTHIREKGRELGKQRESLSTRKVD